MKKQRLSLKSWLVLTALTTFLCLGTSASAQSQPVQNNQLVQENDTTRQELARFDQFLDRPSRNRGASPQRSSLLNNPNTRRIILSCKPI